MSFTWPGRASRPSSMALPAVLLVAAWFEFSPSSPGPSLRAATTGFTCGTPSTSGPWFSAGSLRLLPARSDPLARICRAGRCSSAFSPMLSGLPVFATVGQPRPKGPSRRRACSPWPCACPRASISRSSPSRGHGRPARTPGDDGLEAYRTCRPGLHSPAFGRSCRS